MVRITLGVKGRGRRVGGEGLIILVEGIFTFGGSFHVIGGNSKRNSKSLVGCWGLWKDLNVFVVVFMQPFGVGFGIGDWALSYGWGYG